MVVRYDDTHTELTRSRNTVDTGNSVVDSHQDIGLILRRNAYDFRCETISVLEAVRHQVINLFQPHLFEKGNR